jgi:hypothetical protein
VERVCLLKGTGVEGTIHNDLLKVISMCQEHVACNKRNKKKHEATCRKEAVYQSGEVGPDIPNSGERRSGGNGEGAIFEIRVVAVV